MAIHRDLSSMNDRRLIYAAAAVRAVTTGFTGVFLGLYRARIGLVNTMIFTHLPSSRLLITVAFAPSLPVAAALFLLREGHVETDVPTRQSYVLAVVAPNQRTLASGITNLVRLGGWAVAPAVAGAPMGGTSLPLPLVFGAAMKIAYGLLLWSSRHRIKPPEEAA